VRAYSALVEGGRVNEVYNVCSGSAFRLAEIIQKFEAISGIKVAIEIDPARVRHGEVPRAVGDCSKIQMETGWRAQLSLDETLRSLLDYWRGQAAPGGLDET
jgi:GDP-4-dehydro-6-deoxy-D-mannose reductase